MFIYSIICLCVYVGFIDIHYLPEDNQNRLKRVGVIRNCIKKHNFNFSAFLVLLWELNSLYSVSGITSVGTIRSYVVLSYKFHVHSIPNLIICSLEWNNTYT
jgi:hypothetical protein